MTKPDKQLNFRVPDEIAAWLKQHAKDNRRSISAQLTILIEQAMLKQQDDKDDT